MSWGSELWDMKENLEKHTSNGIEFCEKFSHFLKDRCAIEMKYAYDLKRLVKNYQPKKKEEEEYQYSWARAFLDMTKELHDLAGQHEVIAETMGEKLVKTLQNLAQEVKQERKKSLIEGGKASDQNQKSDIALEKSKGKYDKAYKEAEKALDAYRRADEDINLSRAEVEKSKHISNSKSQQCEEAKNDYAAQLQATNQNRRNYYTVQMPQVLQQLQQLDEMRINKIRDVIREGAEIEKAVLPIIGTCIDGMIKASESVDAPADSKRVVDKYKSGFTIPGDSQFEDLDRVPVQDGNSSMKSSTLTIDSKNNKGTVSGKSKKNKGGLFNLFSSKPDEQKDDFSDLTPNQRKKQLQKKLDALNKDIAKERAERDGMLKMKEVYTKNPAMGDPSTLDKKIDENAQKLNLLEQEYRKFQDYLHDAEANLQRHGSDESMTKSLTSNNSQMIQEPAARPPPPVQEVHDSTPSSEQELYTPIEGEDEGLEYQEFDDNYPVIGTCRALYSFEAVNEGSVSMTENEEMFVLETDQGDGWTRVRKKNDSEGFVPTSYIQSHFYDQDAV